MNKKKDARLVEINVNKRRKTAPIKIPIKSHSPIIHLIHNSDSETESENDSESKKVNENVACLGCRYNEPGQRAHMEKGGCLSMESDTDSEATIEDPSLFEHENDKTRKCQGCQENQANQLAHMDPGGCLYMPDDE